MRTDISPVAIRARASSIKVRKQHIYRECEFFIKNCVFLDDICIGGLGGAHVHQVQQTRTQADEDARYQVTCYHDVTEQPVHLMAAHVAFFLAHGHWLFDEA